MGKSCFITAAVILLFLAGIAGLAAMILGTVFYATSGVVESADSFLTHVANGQFSEAKESLSAEFSRSVSDEEFEQLVKQHQLDQYKSVFWNQRSINNKTGELSGSITTQVGGTVPVKLVMVFESSAWKIQSIEATSPVGFKTSTTSNREFDEENGDAIANLSERTSPDVVDDLQNHASHETDESEPFPPTEPESEQAAAPLSETPVLTVHHIPNRQQSIELIQRWTGEFGEGVKQQDFSRFHGKTAREFQEQIPLEKFTEIFSEFLRREISLEWIKEIEPQFVRAPALNADGILETEGHFPANPVVNFKFSFVWQDNTWKPLSLNFQVKPENVATLPSKAESTTLAIDTTRRFGDAVAAGDFGGFHPLTATIFREKYNLEKFTTIFKSFLETQADLKWIGNTQPVFDVDPALDTNGMLTLRGHFPADPRVNFSYNFMFEDKSWRLIAIDISIPHEAPDSENAGDE